MAALRGNALAIVALVILVGLTAWLSITEGELDAHELTAVATFALVWATGWFLKQENDRAKKSQNTELFLRLREHVISPEYIARRHRVIALLKYLERERISPNELKFSPDIELYLNDYTWIGRLVQDGMLTEEHAWATYGRNLLILYPMLKPYIEKERDQRQQNNLWRGTSDLYEKFKQFAEDALKKDGKAVPKDPKELIPTHIIETAMERWLRPSTNLTSGVEIVVGRLLQDIAAQEYIVLRHYFDGRNGQRYHVDYFNFPGAPRDEARNNLALPLFADVGPQLDTFIRKVWRGYKDDTVARTIAKFDKFARFALAYCDGKLVAFNVYKVGLVETKAGPAKTIYVEHAGTLPRHQRNGVTQAIRSEFYRRENPDIICGSSANQLIYHANKNIAKARGMEIYPSQPQLYVPDAIQELAIQIVETLRITNAALEPKRLVRIYDSPVAPSPVPHELQDLLQLDNTMHVFYILVNEKLNETLLEHGK